MRKEEIYFLVRKKLKAVEEKLLADSLGHSNPEISKIDTHITGSGGKRIRPLFVILCAGLCGYSGDDDVFYGAIMESIHAATLLHDDVIDESDLRRAKASANALYGNKIPVLVGDHMYAKSLVMLLEKGDIVILKSVIETVMAVTEGQIIETEKIKDASSTEEDYFKIIERKTASLIATCFRIGGIVGNLSEEKQDILEAVGLKLGLAFQLTDDALDYVAQKRKLGKPLGNDLRDGNYTLPIIHCLKNATENEQENIRQALDSETYSERKLEEVLELMRKYGSIEYVMKYAEKYVAEAKEHLLEFKDNKYRRALISMAGFISKRDW